MKTDLDQVVKRTRQYWFTDGLVEIVNGAIFLSLGLYFYAQYTLPSGSLWLFMLQAGFLILLMGAIFLGKRLVKIFKTRLTYPRTGYVVYHRSSKAMRWISAGVGLLMVILLIALFSIVPISMNWLPAITGFVVAVFWLISASRVGLMRFYLLATGSILLGAGLSFANIGDLSGSSAYYTGMGLLLVISGGITLTKYLLQSEALEGDPTANENTAEPV